MGARRYLLEQEELLQFFEQVFGMVGPFYGESDFYHAHPDRAEQIADRVWRGVSSRGLEWRAGTQPADMTSPTCPTRAWKVWRCRAAR